MKRKGIVISTDNKISIHDLKKPLLKSLRKAVGGNIEIVRPKRLPRPFVMIVNGEGCVGNFAANLFGCYFYGTDIHGFAVYGDIIIMREGFVNGEPDIVNLTQSDIDEFAEMITKATKGNILNKPNLILYEGRKG